MDEETKRRINRLIWTDRIVIVVMILVFAALFGGIAIGPVLWRGSITDAGFERAEVAFTTNYTTEGQGFVLNVVAKLENGREVHVRTTSVALSAHVTDTVCLNVSEASGDRRYYRIVPGHNCDDL